MFGCTAAMSCIYVAISIIQLCLIILGYHTVWAFVQVSLCYQSTVCYGDVCFELWLLQIMVLATEFVSVFVRCTKICFNPLSTNIISVMLLTVLSERLHHVSNVFQFVHGSSYFLLVSRWQLWHAFWLLIYLQGDLK